MEREREKTAREVALAKEETERIRLQAASRVAVAEFEHVKKRVSDIEQKLNKRQRVKASKRDD